MFDEMLSDQSHRGREPYRKLLLWLENQNLKKLSKKSTMAEELFRRVGITFNVYGNEDGEERLIPFDLIPRILALDEWQKLEKGIIQRVVAINAFLQDVYNGQEIIRAGIIPEEQISSQHFYPKCPALYHKGVYTHVVGVDIIRTDSEFLFWRITQEYPLGFLYDGKSFNNAAHVS